MPSERRRVPLSLQAVFVASNRGQYVNSPPPGNVAIRVFQSIFKRPLSHRFSRRTYKYVDSATKKEVGLIIPSSTNEVLHKPISHHQQQTDHNDNKCETSCSNIEMEIPRQSRDLYVNYPSASYRSSNATTIACSVDSEDLNYDNLYSSPVKYKAKVSIKALFTPQSYLDTMLEKRGYSTERYFVHESGYYNQPTPLQQLSYHPHIIDLVKSNDTAELTALFTAGLSTNPANAHGEGLINLVCRIGAVHVLKAMIDSGCDVQVSDDYGRTPLHDACWSPKPNFEIIEMLLKIDPHMLYMMDVRGSCPLSYVPEQDYDEWIRFLMSKREVIWPHLEKKDHSPPILTLQLPNTRPLKNPRIVLPRAFIKMLAAGRMNPKEVMFLRQTYEDEEDLHSFVDEDFSFNGASYEEDSISSSSDDMSCTSRSCNYDDVSVMSTREPVDTTGTDDDFRLLDSNGSTILPVVESQAQNGEILIGSPHQVSNISSSNAHHNCREKHPIFSTPPCCQWSSASGDDIFTSSEEKVVIDTVFSPLRCRSLHKKYNAATFAPKLSVDDDSCCTTDCESNLQKGTYCSPDDDSGLLFRSC